MIRVIVEVDEGPIDLRMEFDDSYTSTNFTPASQRVLELTAKAESATIAALNATPRKPVDA